MVNDEINADWVIWLVSSWVKITHTILVHPIEPQLTRFIGPTAVHQAWECQKHTVGPSSWNLSHRHSGQSSDQNRCVLQRHLLAKTQLAVTIQPPREDITSWKWK